MATATPTPKVNHIGLPIVDYRGGKSTLCAGCGHNAISERIIDAMYEMGVPPERVIKPSGIGCFAGDLPEAEQKLVYATQGVPVADLFNQKAEGTAWKTKPSWYIVAKNDRTVHPDLERFVAKRMGATTYEADSSHVPMLSNPGLVIDVIRAATAPANQ